MVPSDEGTKNEPLLISNSVGRVESAAAVLTVQQRRHSGLEWDKGGLEGDYVIKAFGKKHGEAIISIHIFIMPPLSQITAIWLLQIWFPSKCVTGSEDYWVMSFSGLSWLGSLELSQRLCFQSECDSCFVMYKIEHKVDDSLSASLPS